MKKRNKFILTSVIITGVLVAAAFLSSHKKVMVTPSLPPTLVKLSPVAVHDIPIVATATGNLVANQQTDISPKVGGYVSNILFNEGDFVKAGTVIIQLDNQKQQDDLAAAKADADLSHLQYQNDFKSYKKGLILQETVYNDKVTDEKNQAIVKSDQTALQDMSLSAPFSGYLSAKNFSLGDYVAPGQKLVTLVDRQHLKVNYSLPSRYTPQIKINQPVIVTEDSLPNKTFRAKVTFISPYVDSDSQTIEVHALLDNKSGDLNPGQFVNVKQTLGTHANAILVPENSVFATLNGYYVFEVNNNKVVAVPVKIGEHINGKIQIVNGLKPGDSIVTTGQDQIKAGDVVKVVTTNKAPAP